MSFTTHKPSQIKLYPGFGPIGLSSRIFDNDHDSGELQSYRFPTVMSQPGKFSAHCKLTNKNFTSNSLFTVLQASAVSSLISVPLQTWTFTHWWLYDIKATYIYFQNKVIYLNYQSHSKTPFCFRFQVKNFLIWKIFALYLKQKGVLLSD